MRFGEVLAAGIAVTAATGPTPARFGGVLTAGIAAAAATGVRLGGVLAAGIAVTAATRPPRVRIDGKKKLAHGIPVFYCSLTFFSGVQVLTLENEVHNWSLSLHSWGDRLQVSLSGEVATVLEQVLWLLRDPSREAWLEVSHRPVLSQKAGQLRLDAERFWEPRWLELVGRSRRFVRARVLYDFPGPGFFRAEKADPGWEQALREAVCRVFAPDLKPRDLEDDWDLQERFGFQPGDPRFLDEFERCTGPLLHLDRCRLHLDRTLPRWSLAELRVFLERSVPDQYLLRPMLPAIVLGGPPQVTSQFPWVQFFQHQHAGYSCFNNYLSGAVLPLAANRDRSGTDPGDVLDGLEAMSEDPDRRVLRQFYPFLVDLSPTHGDVYSQEQLDRLYRFVAGRYRLPRFVHGYEALIELEDCDPLEWFAGWSVACISEDQIAYRIYDRETDRSLRELFGADLQAYFLWGNSD